MTSYNYSDVKLRPPPPSSFKFYCKIKRLIIIIIIIIIYSIEEHANKRCNRKGKESVLGPLLFSIYIDDITGVALSPQSDLVLYADDVLLYCIISCLEDVLMLQSDIDSIETWSAERLLQLNPVKCKHMLISKRRHLTTGHFTLFLNGNELEEVDIFKYLGVLIKNNLSWTDHTAEICSKARKILGLLYRHFYNHSSSESLRQLYLSLVAHTWNMLHNYGTHTPRLALTGWNLFKNLH